MLAWNPENSDPAPAILVCHAWGGRGEFEDRKAVELAKLGYTAFAADVYGKGRRGRNREENSALLNEMLQDRPLLQNRLMASLDTMSSQAEADSEKTAAIGFCFGGLCVLDIVRTGASIDGVVSFHGLFQPPGNAEGNTTNSRVLMLHGWDDPMATPDAVVEVAREFTELGADWQLHGYGNTLHAFSNPAAADYEHGTVYDPKADARSWMAMTNFLAELFQ